MDLARMTARLHLKLRQQQEQLFRSQAEVVRQQKEKEQLLLEKKLQQQQLNLASLLAAGTSVTRGNGPGRGNPFPQDIGFMNGNGGNGEYEDDEFDDEDDEYPDTMQFVQAEYNNDEEEDDIVDPQDFLDRENSGAQMDDGCDGQEDEEEFTRNILNIASKSKSCDIKDGSGYSRNRSKEMIDVKSMSNNTLLQGLLNQSIFNNNKGDKLDIFSKKQSSSSNGELQKRLNAGSSSSSSSSSSISSVSNNSVKNLPPPPPLKKAPHLKQMPNSSLSLRDTSSSNDTASSKPPLRPIPKSKSKQDNQNSQLNYILRQPVKSQSVDLNSMTLSDFLSQNHLDIKSHGINGASKSQSRISSTKTSSSGRKRLTKEERQLLVQQEMLAQYQLQSHILNINQIQYGKKVSAKSSRSASVPRCTICRKTFATNQVLERHMAQHADPVEYTCDACGKICIGAFSYQKHMRIHKRSAIHRCRICYKTFTTLDSLKYHSLVHDGDFKCRACRRGFPSLDALEAHEATHKRYECKWCEKYFMNSGNLKAHERIHTNERPYRCATCPKAFKQLGGLQYHLKTNVDHTAHKYPIYEKDQAEASSSDGAVDGSESARGLDLSAEDGTGQDGSQISTEDQDFQEYNDVQEEDDGLVSMEQDLDPHLIFGSNDDRTEEEG